MIKALQFWKPLDGTIDPGNTAVENLEVIAIQTCQIYNRILTVCGLGFIGGIAAKNRSLMAANLCFAGVVMLNQNVLLQKIDEASGPNLDLLPEKLREALNFYQIGLGASLLGTITALAWKLLRRDSIVAAVAMKAGFFAAGAFLLSGTVLHLRARQLARG